MSIVQETLTLHLPAKRKTTPSGWTSFNAPCCVHNGDSPDKRQRGGLISNQDGGISYHCFNCGFKASWVPGRQLSYKMRKLFQWLGAPDDTITKLALQCLQIAEVGNTNIEIKLPKFEKKNLPNGARKLDQWDDWQALESTGVDNNLFKVFEYLKTRNLFLDDYPFHWTPELGFRDRIIIPFYHKGEVVGYTARKIKDGNPKYLSDQQPGYVFNLDAQNFERIYTIVVEGPFDAIAVEGVALLGSEIKDQQAMLLNSLNTTKIVVPDRDEAGSKLIDEAIELGWSVSMPDWDSDVKDVNDAVIKYGKIYTLHSIISNSESSELKIKLRSKKWFG
tara:strand:- start:1492 stop:2493 length:1002 start_codon:yes stop_codon:yes gene_type:complete